MSAFNIDFYLNIVQQVYADYMRDVPEENRDALNASIFKLRRAPRWYLINNDEALDSLWASVREDDAVLDFVMEGTARFLLKASMHQVNFETLISHSAKSLSWVTRSAIVDSSITERAGSYDWFSNVFKEATWVLFLYLLSTVPQVE